MARPGHLYVMDAGEGRVKVGFSRDPEGRRRALRSTTILHLSPWHDKAELIEKAAHRLLGLAGLRYQSEVYEASLERAVEAINEAFALADSLPNPRRPNRTKPLVTMAIDRDLLARLDRWIAEQDVRLSKTAVWEVALREFLERHV